MSVEAFVGAHPTLWHVVEAEGLPGVRAEGLLPAAEIQRRAGVAPSGNREDFLALPMGPHLALLRYQQMRDGSLLPSLGGDYAGRPAAWRSLLDSHVFFWATPGRRDAFLAATTAFRRRHAPSAPDPVVLAFSAASLAAALDGRLLFSFFNSGSAQRGGRNTPRDGNLFQPLARWKDLSAARPPGGRRAAEVLCPGPVGLPALRGACADAATRALLAA